MAPDGIAHFQNLNKTIHKMQKKKVLYFKALGFKRGLTFFAFNMYFLKHNIKMLNIF